MKFTIEIKDLRSTDHFTDLVSGQLSWTQSYHERSLRIHSMDYQYEPSEWILYSSSPGTTAKTSSLA